MVVNKSIFSLLGILPLSAKIILILGILIVLTIIILKRKIVINFGKTKINIGSDNKKNLKKQCMECSMYHRVTLIKLNNETEKLLRRDILDKKNFMHKKLLEIKRLIYTIFSNQLKEYKFNNGKELTNTELKDLNTRLELVINSTVKDEIKRSFIENGFHKKNDNDFDKYVSNQVEVIINLLEEDLLLFYSNDYLLETFKLIQQDIYKQIYCIYEYTKECELKLINNINKLETKHNNQLDGYISNKFDEIGG